MDEKLFFLLLPSPAVGEQGASLRMLRTFPLAERFSNSPKRALEREFRPLAKGFALLKPTIFKNRVKLLRCFLVNQRERIKLSAYTQPTTRNVRGSTRRRRRNSACSFFEACATLSALESLRISARKTLVQSGGKNHLLRLSLLTKLLFFSRTCPCAVAQQGASFRDVENLPLCRKVLKLSKERLNDNAKRRGKKIEAFSTLYIQPAKRPGGSTRRRRLSLLFEVGNSFVYDFQQFSAADQLFSSLDVLP